jgi:glycerophosphoryl diester phosphodiesterase
MRDAPRSNAGTEGWRSKVSSFLRREIPYVYLLRVPILTGFGFAGVCYLALFTPARSHMGGAFDINSYWGIFLVSLIAFLFASTVGVTWRLIRCYGPRRFFGRDPCASNPGIAGSLGYLVLISAVALPPVAGAIWRSTPFAFSAVECEESVRFGCKTLTLGGAVGWACLGFLTYLIFIVGVATLQLGFSKPGRFGDYEVYDDSGEKIGRVGRLVVDESTGQASIEVETSFLGRRSRVVPMEKAAVDEENRRITVESDAASDGAELTGESPRLEPTPERTHDIIPDVFLLGAAPPLGRYFDWLGRRDWAARLRLAWLTERLANAPGYVPAALLFFITLLVYLVVGVIDFVMILDGEPTYVPTLGYALLLFTLLCWGFSSLTFLLDRYRVPVLVPLIVILWFTSFFPGLESDYYYPVMEPDGPGASVPESELPKKKPSQEKIIVVAATGGGIQSATWTARVLTGMEEQCREDECDRSFDESVRVISAVSGGSVGTMYFVGEYERGRLPGKKTHPLALKKVVRRAQSSSLDYAVWGLLYPDLVRLFFPLPFKLPWDRGRALQEAWLSQQENRKTGEGLEAKLSRWRNEARAGVRPAVIFNTTVSETGHRLPLTTTEPIKGRLEYEDVLARDETETDVSVGTAARLSAAWPYVSPAARANVRGAAPHLVDGGYYDNYGVASLVEWLDDELQREEEEEDGPDIKEVLVVEIHASGDPCSANETQTTKEDTIEETTAEDTTGGEATALTRDGQEPDRNINDQIERKRGWFYQAYAPPWTALNVRGPAQSGNDQAALDLLVDRWDNLGKNENDKDVDFTRALFAFDGSHPPTSWHLTEAQKRDIRVAWKAEIHEKCNSEEGWDKVAGFLGAKTKPEEPGKTGAAALPPKDWPAGPLNIAHRGGRYLAPENTLTGFQEGLLRAGVDVLEFDVHLTRDDELVVIHDDKVNRTTDGTGLVREMSLQEIKSLDAGYNFPDEDSETHPYRDQGITVPTLGEVYRQFPKTPVNIEIKEATPGIEEKLWEEIEEAEAADRTLVVSQQSGVIERFREVSGKRVSTGASIGEGLGFILWSHLYPSLLLHSPYGALQVPKEIVTPDFVQAAHRSHKRVDAWTVNEEDDMRRSLATGVDGIMTDRPDVLNRVREAEGKDG